MSDSYQISDDDKALFRLAMRKVRPLQPHTTIANKQADHPPPAPSTGPGPASVKASRTFITPLKKLSPQKNITQENISLQFHNDLPELASNDVMQFVRPGIQHRELRKLQQGRLAIQATLDLHQLTIDQALQQCQQFITYCQQQHFRYALLIHGKGKSVVHKPKLKNALNHWLRDQPAVLAFHSAIISHGGSGAVYLLLKNPHSY